MTSKPPYTTALKIYIHRYTMEHVPQWTKQPAPNGKFYAPQYATDREWYENTTFPTDKREKYCHSVNPSWPIGQWLDEPFSALISYRHKES